MTLAERLKALRTQRQWSQQQLAQAAKLTQPDVSRIELGRIQQPRLAVLRRLAEALGTSIDYLTGRVDTVDPSGLLVTDSMAKEIMAGYAKLGGRAKQQLRDYVQFLMEQERKARKEGGRTN